jgi:hypothetical protein
MSLEPIQEQHLRGLQQLLKLLKDRLTNLVGPALTEFFPLPPADTQSLPADQQVRDCHSVLRHVKGIYDFVMERLVEEAMAAPAPGEPEPQRMGYRFDVSRLARFPDQRPVFVVGARYSGAGTLSKALCAGADWLGWEEGHLFSTLPFILSTIKKTWDEVGKYETGPKEDYALGQVDAYQIMNQILQVTNRTYAGAAAARHVPRWVDNSPTIEGVMVVPLLGQVYPQAKFIFLHRHPLRSVLSYLQDNPNDSVELAGMMWVLAMRAWYQVRKSLTPDRFLEIGLADLVLRTEHVSERLSPFLGLTEAQARAVQDAVASRRAKYAEGPESPADLYLAETGWPEVVQAWFREVGETTARYWGYQLARPANPV